MSVPQRQPISDRFWSKVEKTDGCWVWTAATDKDGYGWFKVTVAVGLSRQEKAHRVSWVLTYGPLRDEDLVLHRCDNPPCVRPTHLFVGDPGVNFRDAIVKERMRWARNEAHPFAKLSDKQVSEIRRLFRDEGLFQREIAERFGVGQAYVSRLVRGLSRRPE